MMRLRVLELPMVHLGEVSNTPFCLVFDRMSGEDRASLTESIGDMKALTGAQAVLCFSEEVELP